MSKQPDITLLKSLLGVNSTAPMETGKTSSASSAKSTRQSGEALLQNYEDELAEFKETSELDVGELIDKDATVQEIEEEITSKQEEITELQESTDEYIQKCQDEIQRIFANGTDVIPSEVQSQYNSRLSAIMSDSSSNTKSMQELSAVISENESTIDKAEAEIEAKETEIKEYEKELETLEGKEDETSLARIDELNEKIGTLNSEIRDLRYTISTSTSVIDNAESEYSSLSKENDNLSKEQTGLMDTLMDDYYKDHSEEDRVYEDSALASQISGLENYIKDAQESLTTNTLKLTVDIEILTKLKAQKEQEAAASAVSGASGSTGATYSTGGTYTGDLPTNNQLAQIAQSTAASQNTTGWCLRGVNDSLEKAYGFRLSYNSAYQAIPALQARGDFTEVTNQYPNAQSLTNLPAGAIVVWENSSNHPHGHISIALGNGQEASDHIQSQTVNYGTQYHVFIKTS